MKDGNGNGQLPLVLPEQTESEKRSPKGLGARLREIFGIECPTCRHATVPFGASKCPGCGAVPTLESAIQASIVPLIRYLERRALHATPQQIRLFQWGYLFISALVLWWLLPLGSGLSAQKALSVVYVAVLGFYAVWLAPMSWRIGFFHRSAALVKIAVSLNFFSFLLVLQLFIDAHWNRATELASLFGIAWLGAYLLHCYILPLFAITLSAFLGGQEREDPTINQGRRVRSDS